ncbi:MAG: histidine--tRNA ligase [Oligoflexia bacterium]|nr:histidine--tRNA ligase [Oligoflexia bacterium]
MSKIKNISGFPEWLPQQKIVEERLIQRIKAIYSSFGFTPIETPAVELVSTLTSGSEVDKEIYAIRRLHDDGTKEAELALHFDLTVPLARYVAQHFSELDFPFKRYQLQKSWRGDRPQKGRFREFYQFDIDIIARDTLPLSADAETIMVLDQVFEALDCGKYLIRLNNRKILLGIYASLGLDDEQRRAAIVAVDKILKIGRDGVTKELTEQVKLDSLVAEKIVDLADVRIVPSEAEYILSSLEIDDKTFVSGKQELVELISILPEETLKNIQIDLSLARGLDYYTGVILEVQLEDYPQFGTVASGGRYDDLASRFINKKLPGVGVSLGLTRFLDLAFSNDLFPLDRKSPTQVLVAVNSEQQRKACNEVAQRIRDNGIACEVSLGSQRLGKQIDYADAKGVRFVIFVDPDTQHLEVKDLVSKEQHPIGDLSSWCRTTFGAIEA